MLPPPTDFIPEEGNIIWTVLKNSARVGLLLVVHPADPHFDVSSDAAASLLTGTRVSPRWQPAADYVAISFAASCGFFGPDPD